MKKYIIFTSILVVSFFGGINQGYAEGSNNSSSTNTTTTTSTNNTTNYQYENLSDIPGFENYDSDDVENIVPYKDQETANQESSEYQKKIQDRIEKSKQTIRENQKQEEQAKQKKEQAKKEQAKKEQAKKELDNAGDTLRNPEGKTAAEILAATEKYAAAERKSMDEKVSEYEKGVAEKASLEAQLKENQDLQIANQFDDNVRKQLLEEEKALQSKINSIDIEKLEQAATEAKSNYANGLGEDLKYAQEEAKAEHEKACASGDKAGKCLDQSTFVISMNDTIGVGFKTQVAADGTKLDNTSKVINYTLGTIIQKLMVALGVLSVLIMTIGAGYIIMYHGQDELLSKGKSIFMSGITALIVALSSYYIVSILRFILYN